MFSVCVKTPTKPKNTGVVQRFILTVCNSIMLKANGLTVKRIFMQHILVLYDYLSDNFVRCRFIHVKASVQNEAVLI